jgi:hypothetical protein
VFLFGALLLEGTLRWLNRFIWSDDPTEIPTDEQFLGAWALQNLQPFVIGAVASGLWKLVDSVGVIPTIGTHEIAIPLLAVGTTIPLLGIGVSMILRIPLTRAMLLVAICTVLMLSASISLVFAWAVVFRMF